MWAIWAARAPCYLCHPSQSALGPVGTDRAALNVLPGTDTLGADVRGPGMRAGTQMGEGRDSQDCNQGPEGGEVLDHPKPREACTLATLSLALMHTDTGTGLLQPTRSTTLRLWGPLLRALSSLVFVLASPATSSALNERRSFLLSTASNSKLRGINKCRGEWNSRTVVPNLPGTRDQFHGR